MSESLGRVGKVPPALRRRINEACDRFEASWRSDAAPRLEDFVAGWEGAERAALLRELVPLDADYRRGRGENPGADYYVAACPADAETLRALFADLTTVPAPPQQPAPAAEASRATIRPGPAATTLADPNRASPAEAPAQAAAGEPTYPTIPGYEILGQLGKGGMGEVLRGHDLHLDRDLAVKVMRHKYRDEPQLVRRFLAEARIHGRLQHPGIVPLYELGELPDQRPYFTMKLVEGRTLADLLKERPDLTRDLARFLAIFEQVCQAVAYAHSHGVIHRDLKPRNVMVGAFGEVQVMDWGLAKALRRGRGGQAGPSEGAPAANGHAEGDGDPGQGTQAGAVLGTYAYMAPEQARGQVERLDERCDVFGLGGILCEILTGRPPFSGAGVEELAVHAKTCDHAAALAALEAGGADADLVRLVKACLAAEPSSRPSDAGAVAAAMTAYLAGVQERLRRAEFERAAAEARAIEERRRRRAQLGLAAAVLLILTGGGGGFWYVQQQRQVADAAVAPPLAEAGALRDEARGATSVNDLAKFSAALAVARKADELARTGGASDDLRRRAAALVAELDGEAGAVQRDRALLAALLEVSDQEDEPKFHKDGAGLMVELSGDEQYRAAFREWDSSFDVDALSAGEAAARLKGRPPVVVTEVIAALDEWVSLRRQDQARRRQDPAEWQRRWRQVADLAAALDDNAGSGRRELRAIMTGGRVGREQRLGALAMAFRPVPIPFDGGLGEDRGRLRQLAEQMETAREPVLGLVTLAQVLRDAGDRASAERLLQAAIRSRPHEVVLYSALGRLLAKQQPPRWGEAAACYAVTRGLRPELGGALAKALVNSGRPEDVSNGLALYAQLVLEKPDNPGLHVQRGRALWSQHRLKEAEAAFREALRLNPDFPEAHNDLGVALHGQGRHKEAEAEYREALRLQPDYPEAHTNLGNALHGQGRHKEAEAEYREALRLQPDFPEAHTNLGAALLGQGRHKEAEAECREALRLKPDYPEAHSDLGLALHGQGRHKEAEAEYREALRLKPDYAAAHANLGLALHDQGRHKEAEAECREALRLKPDYPEAHNDLGVALHGQGRLKEAEAEYREALRLQPDLPGVHYSLGIALHGQGRLKEAEAAYREALRLKPDYPEAHTNLSLALNGLGRHKEAEAECREALRLQPDLPEAHYSLGNALRDQGRLKEAEAAYREAIRLKPDRAEPHCNLGHVLRRQGRFAEALEAMRRGHWLGSQVPGWRYPSADWVRQYERLVVLDGKLPAVLRGDAEPASAAERLELAFLCKQYKRLHVSAVRFYSDAFTADPQLANDMRSQQRYTAACNAALAAAGQGEDAKNLPDKVQRMLRRQALDWLRADRAVYAKLAERDDAAAKQFVRQQLAHWQQDADLVSVRDKEPLAKLPDDERRPWRQLWDDVAALLARVGSTPP